MSLLRDVSQLRKLGNFVAALFPALGRAWEKAAAHFRARLARGWPARLWARLAQSRLAGPFAKVVERFYWGRYERDRVDWSRLPLDGVAILRAGFLLALALLVLLPLAAALPWPATKLPGADSEIAVWSVVLIAVCLAASRALLLAGAATANRWIFVALALLDLYVAFGLCSAGGRSWLGLLAPLTALAALGASEAALASPDQRDWLGTVASGVAVGLGVGALWALVLPPSAGHGPLKLVVGAAIGVPLGLAAAALGRRSTGAPSSAARLAGLLVVLELALVVATMARAGLAGAAAKDLDLMYLVSGFLWPLWYFAGVGIVFKLLNNAKALLALTREALPVRRLGTFAVLLLMVATLLLWAPAVFDTQSVSWPSWVIQAAALIYQHSKSLVWQEPDVAVAAEMVRWVLLFELGYALFKLVQRRLDAALAATLLLFAGLGAIASWEYVFEQTSFLRSPSHTVAALLAFAVWLLWFLQKIGLSLGRETSPRWPAVSRLSLFAGVLVLLMALVHERGAQRDPSFANEVFLLLYRAVVDVGLPYALYAWGARRLETPPVKSATLLFAFAGGALATLPIHAVDHLVAAGLSLPQLWAAMTGRGAQLLAGDMSALFADPFPPPAWIALRGVLVMGALALLAARAERRTGLKSVPALLLIAASAGFASFTRSMLDVPVLPPTLTALFAPARDAVELGAYTLGSYLVWTLPTLVMALVASQTVGRGRWVVALVGGLSVHLLAALAWPGLEPFLRSSGLLWTLGVAGAAMLWALIGMVRRQAEEEAGQPIDRRRGGVLAWGLAALGLLGLMVALFFQLNDSRSVPRLIEPLGRALSIPARWEPMPAQGVAAAFHDQGTPPMRAFLLVKVEPRPPGGARQALAQALATAQQTLPAFEPRAPSMESTGMHPPKSALVNFYFESPLPNGTRFPSAGTSVARDVGELTLTLTWFGPPGELDRQRWDLARILDESDLD